MLKAVEETHKLISRGVYGESHYELQANVYATHLADSFWPKYLQEVHLLSLYYSRQLRKQTEN